MDDQVRAELTARIGFQEGVVRTWSSAVARPASVEGTARSHSGFAWFDIAVCHLMLGDATRAGEAFARAAELMHSTLEVITPPPLATYTGALESAVLSRDDALADRLAGEAITAESRSSLLGDRLAYALALPALVRGDDGHAAEQARAAAEVPEAKAWYPGLGDAISAIASPDPRRLLAGLERILAKHVAYARAKSSWCYNAGPCLLCVPAAVLARLAVRRGVAVGEIPGRTAAIPLALVHSSPGKTLRVDADFVPEIFTAP